MRSRFLGVALVVLAVLGGLNLVQAIRSHLSSDDRSFTERVDAKTVKHERAVKAGVFLDETFSVSAGDLLVVDVQHADVTIETSASDQARLVVTVTAATEEKAREVFEHMNYRAYREQGRVVLESNPLEENWRWNGRMSIDVRAEIPRTFDVDLTSTHGDVEMQALEGSVNLNTTHGDVCTEQITGPSISISSTHGDICSDGLHADEVAIRTTHGDIEVELLDARVFDAVTTHSDVEIERLAGAGDLVTTHGDVSVGIEAQNGLEIRTTHGDVSIALAPGIGAEVDLRGERVSMPSSLSFHGSTGKKHVEGVVNDGGAPIAVSTTFGEIRVRSD